MYDISFVNLGIVIKSIKNSINIFGFEIAYYGMIIAIGMLLGLQVVKLDAQRKNENVDIYFDFSIFAIIFSIIGARLYYVIFSFDSYKDDLIRIFYIREGGLAIYGAVIAAVLTLFVYAKLKKQSFFAMADTGVLGLILAQSLGRWGNFFNIEAFGTYTNNIFAMQIKRDLVANSLLDKNILDNIIIENGIEYVRVHPTFLYESMWNLFVFVFLLFYRKHQKFKGEIFFLYLLMYGFGRFFIEGLRTDSLMLYGNNFAVSQVLALFCVIFSGAIIFLKRRKSL